MRNVIYLDNAATTNPREQVLKVMSKSLSDFGNPNSAHEVGVKARRLVEKARRQVAELINAKPEQIIFTSGGSEANNLSVGGFALRHFKSKILCGNTEHDSMMKCCQQYYKDAKFKNPDDICIKDIQNADIVSVMHTNNETGKVYNVGEIGKACLNNDAVFVVDAVQALGHYDIDVKNIGCDMMSMSAHKIHGIKGVGALFVKDKALIQPLIYGGETHEFGLRGGTENVPGIVAFGEACKLCEPSRSRDYIKKLSRKFVSALDVAEIEIKISNPESKIIPLTIRGIDAETLVLRASMEGLCISAGAACRSNTYLPNTALIQQGYTADEARQTVRISFSEDNTEEEVIKAAEIISKVSKEFKGE